MSVSELVESDGYKKFMGKVYGFGAAIVLLGALFKIQHYPGASLMLIIGLLTEAFIFFFSAFEPLHEEIDWTLVYPELAGLDEIEEGITAKSIEPAGKTAIERFDELLQDAEVGPGLFEKLGTGLNSLSSTVGNLSDLTDATVATETYTQSVKGAATSVDSLSSSFNKSAEAINSTADVVANSGESYKSLLEGLNTNFTSIGENSKAQSEQQGLLTENLSALNAVYELQLKNSSENLENTEKVTSGINGVMEDLKSTADDVAKYKTEVSKLSSNLQALNTVYGNMLTAMNVNK
jgi:gliding motility-associated protein GldL